MKKKKERRKDKMGVRKIKSTAEKRNNISSIGNNNSNTNNISDSNNQFCIWRGWDNSKSAASEGDNRAGNKK